MIRSVASFTQSPGICFFWGGTEDRAIDWFRQTPSLPDPGPATNATLKKQIPIRQTDRKVTINQLVDIAESIAGIKLQRNYKLDAPKGVNGRNSDNALIQKVFGWEPSISLRTGLEKTYAWIYEQMVSQAKSK